MYPRHLLIPYSDQMFLRRAGIFGVTSMPLGQVMIYLGLYRIEVESSSPSFSLGHKIKCLAHLILDLFITLYVYTASQAAVYKYMALPGVLLQLSRTGVIHTRGPGQTLEVR
jgi:hypothetical protein